MIRVFKISIAFSLLVLVGSNLLSSHSRYAIGDSEVVTSIGQTPEAVNHAGIFSANRFFLIVAETPKDILSKVDPKVTSVASSISHPKARFPKTLYLHYSRSVSISQSVRIMIFPHHSFL